MIRLLTNLAATLVLVLLLVTPGVFSNNLVDFEDGELGIVIYNNEAKFGQFLKINQVDNKNLPQFNVEFTPFANQPALYRAILELENKGEKANIIRIINFSSEISIFFDTGSGTGGPTEIELTKGGRIGVNLLVPSSTQIKNTTFSLKVD